LSSARSNLKNLWLNKVSNHLSPQSHSNFQVKTGVVTKKRSYTHSTCVMPQLDYTYEFAYVSVKSKNLFRNFENISSTFITALMKSLKQQV